VRDHSFVQQDAFIFTNETTYMAFADENDTPIICIEEGLPCDGVYILQEQYCANPRCDCRNGCIKAINEKGETIDIIIGWEDPTFYFKNGYTQEEATNMQQGYLDASSTQQSPYAHEFLRIFRALIADNPHLMEHMKTNYVFIKHHGKREMMKNSNRRQRRKANQNKTKR
jgi:hypothetical protein